MLSICLTCFVSCDSNKSLYAFFFLKISSKITTALLYHLLLMTLIITSFPSSLHHFLDHFISVYKTDISVPQFSTTHRTLEWFDSAEKSRPYEVPPFRIDRVEDLVEPIWVHGVGPGTMDCGSNLEFSRFILHFWMFYFFILFCSVLYCTVLCRKLLFLFFSTDTICFFVCMRRNSFHTFGWILNNHLKEFPRQLCLKTHLFYSIFLQSNISYTDLIHSVRFLIMSHKNNYW